MSTGTDRNSYDTSASADAQGNLQSIISQLETVLSTRDKQVKAAMANFRADGVSDEYQGKEAQWNSAAGEVRSIIALVRTTLAKNDDSALHAQGRAKAAVNSI